MLEETIGFIGCGNMGSAMINGIVGSGLIPANKVIASARSKDTLDRMKETYHIEVTKDNTKVAEKADILFLAVKPNMYEEVIAQIRDCIKKEALIVSIAAGKTIANIEALFGRPVKLVRSMPNTPAMVLESMSALTPNTAISPEELKKIITIFSSFGKCEVVTEKLMDAVTGVSGSSPAYVYMFIEAMADAAVFDGMPRAQAYKFAAQSVLGAAKMVLETGKHPGELKDAVCSPGGTTIEAVAKLEELNLRGTVITAQHTCTEKSKAMSKPQ